MERQLEKMEKKKGEKGDKGEKLGKDEKPMMISLGDTVC